MSTTSREVSGGREVAGVAATVTRRLARAIGTIGIHLKTSKNAKLVHSYVFAYLFQASQASDVGSIPIARSITHDDSVVLTPLNQLKYGHKIGRFGPVMVPTRMVETMAAFLEKQCIVKGPSGPSLIGAVGGGAMAPPLPTRVDRPRSE